LNDINIRQELQGRKSRFKLKKKEGRGLECKYDLCWRKVKKRTSFPLTIAFQPHNFHSLSKCIIAISISNGLYSSVKKENIFY
jgi:hypothetical protein